MIPKKRRLAGWLMAAAVSMTQTGAWAGDLFTAPQNLCQRRGLRLCVREALSNKPLAWKPGKRSSDSEIPFLSARLAKVVDAFISDLTVAETKRFKLKFKIRLE